VTAIGILGAGAVGSYVAAALAATESDVVLVGRRPLPVEVQTSGFVLEDLDGGTRRVDASRISYRTSVSALADRDIVLCCVKSGQTREAARGLAGVVDRRCIIVSLQNGLGNADALRSELPGSSVLRGIVGFNVVERGPGVYRRTTSGPLVLEAATDDRVTSLAASLQRSGFEVKLSPDVRALQWAKLLMNLNNAVSALSDRPTQDLLFQAGYRRIMAAVVREALAVMKRAGIHPGRLTGLPTSWIPALLGIPTPLFRAVARRQLKVDPEARSSMWEDLTRGRPTEVDHLNGEIVRLAESVGVDAPLNRRIVEVVHEEEHRERGSPRLSAEQLWARLAHTT
jgi:2-dehydropantoate 2-reductase